MRETADVAGAAKRMARTLGARIAEEDPSDLWHLIRLQAAVNDSMSVAVRGLRAHGHTDKAIGEALSMTRQAVQQRWPHTERHVGAGARYRRA